MPTAKQTTLPYIPHNIGNSVVSQRHAGGNINATAMCQATGKLFGHYFENRTTQAFLTELSVDIGIPISSLVQALKGARGKSGKSPGVACDFSSRDAVLSESMRECRRPTWSNCRLTT